MSVDTACSILAISSSPDHQPSESIVGFVFSPGQRQTFSQFIGVSKVLYKQEFEVCRSGCLAYLPLDSFEDLKCTKVYLGIGEPSLLNSCDRIQEPHFNTSCLPGFLSYPGTPLKPRKQTKNVSQQSNQSSYNCVIAPQAFSSKNLFAPNLDTI